MQVFVRLDHPQLLQKVLMFFMLLPRRVCELVQRSSVRCVGNKGVACQRMLPTLGSTLFALLLVNGSGQHGGDSTASALLCVAERMASCQAFIDAERRRMRALLFEAAVDGKLAHCSTSLLRARARRPQRRGSRRWMGSERASAR